MWLRINETSKRQICACTRQSPASWLKNLWSKPTERVDFQAQIWRLEVSLIRNQFCSPRFEPMWRYSWRKIDYVPLAAEEFFTAVQFCFNKEHSGLPCSQGMWGIFFHLLWVVQKTTLFEAFFGLSLLRRLMCCAVPKLHSTASLPVVTCQ